MTFWCGVTDKPAADVNPNAHQGTGQCSACGGSLEDDHSGGEPI